MHFNLRKVAQAVAAAFAQRAGVVMFAFDPEDAEAKKAIEKAVKDATAALRRELADKNPDIKQQIEEAVAGATEGLAAKNKELLGELKTLKKGQQIDPEAVAKLEAKIEEHETTIANLTKENKRVAGDLVKASKGLETESAFTQRLLIDNGLQDALVKAGVSNPTRLKASIAMLRGQVKVVPEGDQRKAMVGDKELNAFVTEWAGTDEGKEFVTAKDNSGGGARRQAGGGAGAGDGKDLSKLPPTERLNAARAQNAAKGK